MEPLFAAGALASALVGKTSSPNSAERENGVEPGVVDLWRLVDGLTWAANRFAKVRALSIALILVSCAAKLSPVQSLRGFGRVALRLRATARRVSWRSSISKSE